MIENDLPKDTVGRITPLSDEKFAARKKAYIEIWGKYGETILSKMQAELGLEFEENVLNVYLVSLYDNSHSDPITISMEYEPEMFLEVATHEITHRLLNFNTKHVDVVAIWTGMFPGESRLTRNHVVVFATLTYLFVDVLNRPDLLKDERDSIDADYRRAVEIVDARGYKNIITDFRKHYETHIPK